MPILSFRHHHPQKGFRTRATSALHECGNTTRRLEGFYMLPPCSLKPSPLRERMQASEHSVVPDRLHESSSSTARKFLTSKQGQGEGVPLINKYPLPISGGGPGWGLLYFCHSRMSLSGIHFRRQSIKCFCHFDGKEKSIFVLSSYPPGKGGARWNALPLQHPPEYGHDMRAVPVPRKGPSPAGGIIRSAEPLGVRRSAAKDEIETRIHALPGERLRRCIGL